VKTAKTHSGTNCILYLYNRYLFILDKPQFKWRNKKWNSILNLNHTYSGFEIRLLTGLPLNVLYFLIKLPLSKFTCTASLSQPGIWNKWCKILHSRPLLAPKLKLQNAYVFTSKIWKMKYNLKFPFFGWRGKLGTCDEYSNSIILCM
jgi:hypothetical protein